MVIMDKVLEIIYIGETPAILEQIETISVANVSFTIMRNAMEAVRYLMSGNSPSAILCDPDVRGGDAFEINRFVRDVLGFKTLAFILVSDAFSQDQYHAAFKERLDDYFVFPVDSPQYLIDRIRMIREYRIRTFMKNEIHSESMKFNMPLSKRIFDILVAVFSLILLSPLLLIVVIAIRLESRGKFLYSSKRVGRETFDFYKFRSMHEKAEDELQKLASEKNQYSSAVNEKNIDFSLPCPRCAQRNGDGPCSPILHIENNTICEYWFHLQKHEIEKSKSAFIKIENDPRVTKVGRIIRNLSIDELPQLINVIRGDMSLVGNRPLPVYEAEKLTIDQAAKRFLAPAGLTGLWQIEKRGRPGPMSEEERKKLDNEYADVFLQNRYSLWYDLKLIVKTIPALFQKESV